MYNTYLQELKKAKTIAVKKSIHYRRLKRFDVLCIGNEDKHIFPVESGSEDIRYYVCNDKFFDIIHAAHIEKGHGDRDRINRMLKKKFKNINVEAINVYLKMCETCQKKHSMPNKGLVKPILHNDMNSRCQIDLIDMQSNPNNGFKYIMVYQDHLTKFVIIRPLRCKRAEEIAYQLLDIFTLFGAPSILHSDNGREFVNKIVTSVCKMLPQVKIVHGKARHSQSQGSVERANQDIESIKRSPYEAMFGCTMKMELATSSIPKNVITELINEDDLIYTLMRIRRRITLKKSTRT
ncbi:hypothetical protein QTP88_028689 [Uroleucon formosanum]